ncbi:MAG: hypothetical protein LBP39_00470 [Rickettsiales bacterium]|nr:hypothetical protein [Rickettsiales bacterium]
MSNSVFLRDAIRDDVFGIYKLYLEVAKTFPDSITQHISEITLDFVNEIITLSMRYGLAMVAEDSSGTIVGFFKAFTSPYRNLAHVMMNTTLISTPDATGRKIFILILRAFLDKLKNEYRHIYKLQGRPHETNRAAINCYLRNGITIEHVFNKHIFNFNKYVLENEVIVSWLNPNFDPEELNKYHRYLPNAKNQADNIYFKTPLQKEL